MSMESTSRVWADDNYAHIKPLPDPPKRPDAMQQRRNIVRADSILDDSSATRPMCWFRETVFYALNTGMVTTGSFQTVWWLLA